MRPALFMMLLLAGLVPGVPGAVEDAVHLFAEGHTLHADPHGASAEASDPSDDPSDEDAGCEDCGHGGLCHCHGGSSFAAAPLGLVIASALQPETVVDPATSARLATRALAGLERPPRA